VCQLLRRQIATFALSILGGFLVATGCSKTSDRAEAVVRIGYQKTGTLNLIRLRGTLSADLARLGVQVEWIGFPAGPQLLEALNAGAIDFGHAGDAPPILAQAAGVPFVYVANEPPRPLGEAIIVKAGSPLRTVADLKGKRVALNKGSNVHYLLVRAFESAGIPYDQVHTIFLSPSDARAAFEGGSVDAWAVWDPYLAEAEVSIGARLLTNGTGLVTNRDFHLASRRFAGDHPEVVRVIFHALARECRWAVDHRDEVAKVLAAELGLEETVLKRVVGRREYGAAAISDDVLADQQRVADVFLGLGLIPDPIVVREAIVPDLLGNHPGSSDPAISHNGVAK
jgi:sulfonate transport system substrate-binding protein